MDEQTIAARVRSLEREARRLRWACLTLAVGLGATVLTQLPWPRREVSAQRFVLKDGSGSVRAEWGPSEISAGTIDGERQKASSTCLRFRGQGPSALMLCAPWERYGGPSLSMREEKGAKLDIAVDAYTVSILARSADDGASGRSTLALGAWMDGAAVNVTDKAGRRTHVGGDGLTAYGEEGTATFQTPGANASRR
jgi:hypothetical protein